VKAFGTCSENESGKHKRENKEQNRYDNTIYMKLSKEFNFYLKKERNIQLSFQELKLVVD